MRMCDLAWSLWAICCLCSFWSCVGPMLMRGNFLWKMLHFDHGYVTCLYVPIYLVGDACTKFMAILLVCVNILACCSALCIFEKHMRICRLDSCITNKAEESTKFMHPRGVLHQWGENLGEMHLFRGSLHSCIWELFVARILVVLFC
jgi:hypothetical protein